jgi:proline iminopeptidase
LIGLLVFLGLSVITITALVVPNPITSTRAFCSSCSLHAAAASNAINEGYLEVSRPGGSKHQLSYRIVRPMSLSSTKAAPIVALHGGPSVPSNYLYPLEGAIPYRSIVFYDQLGCGKSDEPKDINQYSIKDSVEDLKLLLKKLGVRRFHLYGQSYGGILAYEYMKSVAMTSKNGNDAECLSAILSSAPSNVSQVEEEFVRLLDELKKSHSKDDDRELSDTELGDLFRTTHQCRIPEMPALLKDAYANAGSVWRGTDAIKDYIATPPTEDASRMPSSLIMRGEYDFVSDECVEAWKSNFNTKFLRYKTLKGCSHHGLFEDGATYGEHIDSFCAEYD